MNNQKFDTRALILYTREEIMKCQDLQFQLWNMSLAHFDNIIQYNTYISCINNKLHVLPELLNRWKLESVLCQLDDINEEDAEAIAAVVPMLDDTNIFYVQSIQLLIEYFKFELNRITKIFELIYNDKYYFENNPNEMLKAIWDINKIKGTK